MRKILLLVVFSTIVWSIAWEKDMKSAIAKAKIEHKNLMVLVESEHCRWCIKMKGRTLSDANVTKRLENFVLVKVMREDPTAMDTLPPVKGAPTIFFMEENLTVIEDILGYFNVEDFLSYIDDVEKKVKQLK